MILLSSYKQIRKIPIKNYLSKREIEEYKKISEFEKNGWLAARFGIKKEIKYFLKKEGKDVPLNKIEITRKKLQKPISKIPVKIDKKINISISHCGNIAIAAIEKDRFAGCDIEKIRNFEYNTLRSFLAASELKIIEKAKLCDQPFLATLLWSLKESYLKAIGCGLMHHPRYVEIQLDFEKGTHKLYDNNKEINCEIQWSNFRKNYVITKIIVFKE